MSRKISTPRDPFDAGFQLYRFKEFEFQEGLTVLVGCNGAGKTTLMTHLKRELEHLNIPVWTYGNEGSKHRTMERAGFFNDIETLATMMCSSEGENISNAFGAELGKVRKFILDPPKRSFWDIDDDDEDASDEMLDPHERWVLLDAVDSGYSIDNIMDLKGIFTLMQRDARGVGNTLYIVVSANSYELANGENCMDVYTGKYKHFKDYEEYKKFILGTRAIKERRYKSDKI